MQADAKGETKPWGGVHTGALGHGLPPGLEVTAHSFIGEEWVRHVVVGMQPDHVAVAADAACDGRLGLRPCSLHEDRRLHPPTSQDIQDRVGGVVAGTGLVWMLCV